MRGRRGAVTTGLALGALGLAGCGQDAPAPVETVTVSQPAPSPTSTTTGTLQQAFSAAQGGVVRIEVAGCEANVQGSGFYVRPDLVVTAAHVVTDAQVIRVIADTTSTAAAVVGMDTGRDIALLETAADVGATPLQLSDVPAVIGDQVAAIGFTLGDKLSFKPGTVNAVDKKSEIDGVPRYGLMEIDAPTNQGNSGGPVVNLGGDVVGVVDAGPPDGSPGLRLAIPAAAVGERVSAWEVTPAPVAAASCPTVYGPDGRTVDTSADPTNGVAQAVNTLAIYFQSINNGDFPTAIAQLARPIPLQAFQQDVASSHDDEFEVLGTRVEQGAPIVWVRFVSTQASGKGPAERPAETCTVWSQDYHFAQRNGLWLVDRSAPHPGVDRNAPCPAG